MRVERGVARQILESTGVRISTVRSFIEGRQPRTDHPDTMPEFSASAKRLLKNLGKTSAFQSEPGAIGTADILVALLRTREDHGARRALVDAGIVISGLRQAVESKMAEVEDVEGS
jgi:hypothetical protein